MPESRDFRDDPVVLLEDLIRLREAVAQEGDSLFAAWEPQIQRERFKDSAANLANYLALRRRDIRPLQEALPPWGLSSLGRSESFVLPNLDAVIATLSAVCGRADVPRPEVSRFREPGQLLLRNTIDLFGPSDRSVRIMVTLPAEAAGDPTLISDLARGEADLFRINCAHDGPDLWDGMLDHVRAARESTGKELRVLMDLGGPKARTLNVRLPESRRERVFEGDLLLLTDRDNVASPLSLQCSLPDVLSQVDIGHRVRMDDGKITALVEQRTAEGLLLRITHVRQGGQKLQADKGLNFPDTRLDLPPLTDTDLAHLDYVTANADLVGYSFVQNPDDIDRLFAELDRRSEGPLPGIILKIETQFAFRRLPDLIVRTAGRERCGVMIARGDLAAELGYGRLVEIQEELLWFCEAAHLPVIWATQVLETMVKKGLPSRAEMTDAAMAERAECIMLNKGPFIREGARMLDEVIRRMEGHQRKKTARLRKLSF
ncbi:MAG: pyruvate kinase [Capsulimonadales bacterium]|nr:pyruvate kinase [Capsulimonadales bacterium]